MDKRTIEKVTRYLNARLAENKVEVSQFILFGSQAKKTAGKDSDIDLIIVSENFRKKSIFERADMVGDAVYKTICKYDVPIDALLKTPEELDKEYLDFIGAVVIAA